MFKYCVYNMCINSNYIMYSDIFTSDNALSNEYVIDNDDDWMLMQRSSGMFGFCGRQNGPVRLVPLHWLWWYTMMRALGTPMLREARCWAGARPCRGNPAPGGMSTAGGISVLREARVYGGMSLSREAGACGNRWRETPTLCELVSNCTPHLHTNDMVACLCGVNPKFLIVNSGL